MDEQPEVLLELFHTSVVVVVVRRRSAAGTELVERNVPSEQRSHAVVVGESTCGGAGPTRWVEQRVRPTSVCTTAGRDGSGRKTLQM